MRQRFSRKFSFLRLLILRLLTFQNQYLAGQRFLESEID